MKKKFNSWHSPRLYAILILTGGFASCFYLYSCSNENKQNNQQPSIVKQQPPFPSAPKFNEDSAYSFVKAQVDFGPRVPGTNAHAKCGEYLISKLKSYGWTVQIQNPPVTTYDGKKFNLKNIIASFDPENNSRVLLISHWDSRPFADRDTFDKNKPFDSADDGPSGVAVVLEIARLFSISKPNVGVDILLDDIEDYGNQGGSEDTWCLGTQYWAKNPHKPGYTANYGILLDMVGAKNATFPREGASNEYAPYLIKKIWNKAAHLGYANYFVFQDVHKITDDHDFINNIANIPCVDIINMNLVTEDFGSHHHRHSDNLDIIDKNTLKAVGQTILEVVWEEQKKSQP